MLHPLLDWDACLQGIRGSPRLLGVLGLSLMLDRIEVEGFPGFTLVHPRRVARLAVNGGGDLEAWEPLETPLTSCYGRPLHKPLWEARPSVNSVNFEFNLLIPLGGRDFLKVRAKPFGRVFYDESKAPPGGSSESVSVGGARIPLPGVCSRDPQGWVLCDSTAASTASARVITASSLVLEAPCLKFKVEVMHPGGFAPAGVKWDLVESNAALFTCPRSEFYVASPHGFRVQQVSPGRLRVEPRGVTVIAPGSRFEPAKIIAALTMPKVDSVWAVARGSPLCMATRSDSSVLRLAAWNPTPEDSFCEVVFKARAGGARVADPVGEVQLDASRGLVRIPLPGFTWALLDAERDRSLAERLRVLRERSRRSKE